jgi:predicted component of type VI protein secretion system
MKISKTQLKQVIKEEIEKLLEEESGFLSNIYKLCSEGPESKKTKWWKGR